MKQLQLLLVFFTTSLFFTYGQAVPDCENSIQSLNLNIEEILEPGRITAPTDIHGDATGNLFISDIELLSISKREPNGDFSLVYEVGSAVFINGIWVSESGDVFSVEYDNDSGTGALKKVIGSNQRTITDQLTFPRDVWGDGLGNLFIAESDGLNDPMTSIDQIIKYDENDQPTVLAGGFSNIEKLWGDANGDLFVVDAGTGTIHRVDTASGAKTNIASGLSDPVGIWGDNNGNIFVTENRLNNQDGPHVIRIEIASGNATSIVDGFVFLSGIWGNDNNEIFIPDAGEIFRLNCGLGNNTVTVTFSSQNRLTFGDPCSCTDPLNCQVGNTLYFHDTLSIPETGTLTPGLDIRIVSATDFYTDVPCNGGTLELAPTNFQIPEVSPGVYKLEFWRPSGAQPTLVVMEGGNNTTAPAATFQPICNQANCVVTTPTNPTTTPQDLPNMPWTKYLLLIGLLVITSLVGIKYIKLT